MTLRQSFLTTIAISALTLTGVILPSGHAQAGNYGCYKVTAPKAVNIRKRAWSKSTVLTTANRGEILAKWKPFCALRGFWCPVEKGGIKGHAAKEYLIKVSCPK